MINLNIGQINIRNLKCNLDILRESVNRNKLDIIILQETWHKTDEVTLCPPGYCEIFLSSIKHEKITRNAEM